METDVAFGAVGVERYRRPIEHNQQCRLVSALTHEQATEPDDTGAPTEDVVDAGTQFATAPRGRVGVILLEIIVKGRGQRARILLCGAMQFGECVQLVCKWFRMHPAERVPANGELASIITDNRYLGEHPMCPDAAHSAPSMAKEIESCVTSDVPMPRRSSGARPRGMIGKPCQLVGCKTMDDVPQPGHARAFSPAPLR